MRAARRRARPSSSSAELSAPPSHTRPADGVSRHANLLCLVVLLAPDAPPMATASPGKMVRSTTSSRTNSPSGRDTRFVSFCAEMIGCNPRSAMCRTLLFIALLWLPFMAEATSVLVLGDSLSAAYGIQQNQGWVALLQQRLAAQKEPIEVVNASISEETTAGGRARSDDLLQRHRPDIVIVELGGNDGLRGLPIEQMSANLDHIVKTAKKHRAQVLLLGMRLPPNYGPAYTQQFHEVYRTLAERHRIALVPFMLEGIADERDAFQADGIHPTAAMQARILDNVWPALQTLLPNFDAERVAFPHCADVVRARAPLSRHHATGAARIRSWGYRPNVRRGPRPAPCSVCNRWRNSPWRRADGTAGRARGYSRRAAAA